MDLKIDSRMVGLRALQEEVIDRSGWDATLGWRRRHGGTTIGLVLDLFKAALARARAIVKVGITASLVAREVKRFTPAVWDVVRLLYYTPLMCAARPEYRMIRARRILRYAYGGYSKCRVACAGAR